MAVIDDVCATLEEFIRAKAKTPESSLINIFATDVERILNARDATIRDLKSRNGELVLNVEAASDKIVKLENALKVAVGLLKSAEEPVLFAAECSEDDSSDHDLLEEIKAFLKEAAQ